MKEITKKEFTGIFKEEFENFCDIKTLWDTIRK